MVVVMVVQLGLGLQVLLETKVDMVVVMVDLLGPVLLETMVVVMMDLRVQDLPVLLETQDCHHNKNVVKRALEKFVDKLLNV